MKKYILFITALGILHYSYAQIINQDADGNSTIFYNGGSTGIDLLRTQISASYHNSFNVGDSPRNLFALGATGQVKNESDFVGFVKSGNFNPKVDLSLKIGGINYWGKYDVIDIVTIEKQNVQKRMDEIDQKMLANQATKADTIEYEQLYQQKIALASVKADNFKKIKYQRIVYYFEGSYSNTNTDIYNDTLATTSINDKVYRGTYNNGAFKLGVNYEYNTFFLGTKLGFGTTNNLSILKPNEISIVYGTDSLDNTVIQNKKQRNVYNQSEIKNFGYFGWDMDVMKFIPLKKNGEAQGTIVLDALYFRYIKNLTQSSNIFNIGTSINYFGSNGKFFGGMYLQVNNVTNWPTASFDNKLQFGLVTKFNFVAIKDFLNQ